MPDATRLAELELRQTQMDKMIEKMIATSEKTNESITKLTQSIHESSVEQRHTREATERMHKRLDVLESSIQSIKEQQASDRPWIDLMQSINGRVWFILVGILFTAVSTIGTIGYMFSKTGAPT